MDGMSLRIVILSYWRKEEIHINILHFRKKKSHIDWHSEQLILSSNIIVTQFDGAIDVVFVGVAQHGAHIFLPSFRRVMHIFLPSFRRVTHIFLPSFCRVTHIFLPTFRRKGTHFLSIPSRRGANNAAVKSV